MLNNISSFRNASFISASKINKNQKINNFKSNQLQKDTISFSGTDYFALNLKKWIKKYDVDKKTLNTCKDIIETIQQENDNLKEKFKNINPVITHTEYVLPKKNDVFRPIIRQNVALLNDCKFPEGIIEIEYNTNGVIKNTNIVLY